MRTIAYTLAAIIALLSLPAAQAQTTSTFAYASRDSQVDPSGTGKKETYDIAIALTNQALIGKSITAIEFPVIPSAKVSGLSAWITTQPRLELVDGKNTNIVDRRWEIEMPASGDICFVGVRLDEPYVIPEGGLYVGYSLTVNETDRTEGTLVPIVTAAGAKEGSFFLHTSRSYLNWRDRSEQLNVTAMTQVEIEGDFYVNAATIDDPAFSYLEVGKPQTVQAAVHNIGMNPITSIEYTATLGDVSHSGVIDLAEAIPAVFAYAQKVDFTLPEAEELGDFDIKIAVTGVNGTPNDATEHFTASGNAAVLKFVPKHLSSVEEFTGTWCGWCPSGFVAMEKMNELYPDFIGIAYHDRDPMTMKGGYPNVASGFPQAWVGRSLNTHPFEATGQARVFSMPQVWEEYCKGFVPARILLDAHWNEDGTVTANSTVEWTLPCEDPEENYRVEYILLADDLYGDNRGWEQHNYYATEPLTPLMEAFCGADSYVKGLHFNDVAILTSGHRGVQGSIESTEVGVPNSYSYSFDTAQAVTNANQPIPFHRDKLRVVALLLKGDDYGTVINAAKCKVEVNGSGTSLSAGDSKTPKAVEYHDIMGRRLATPQSGIYMQTTIYTDGTTKVEKIAK